MQRKHVMSNVMFKHQSIPFIQKAISCEFYMLQKKHQKRYEKQSFGINFQKAEEKTMNFQNYML